jgi:hypothetical protein
MDHSQSSTEPPDEVGVQEDNDEHSTHRAASLAALGFLTFLAIVTAVIVGVRHARSTSEDCSVQEGGVCLALSGH